MNMQNTEIKRFLVIVNCEDTFNGEELAGVVGFFGTRKEAEAAVAKEIENKRIYAIDNEMVENESDIHIWRNNIYLGDVSYRYDIHDLSVNDWSCVINSPAPTNHEVVRIANAEQE